MNISYNEPLSRAWERMKRMLFRPFHIETWFVVGFSEFLARMLSHGGSVAQWNLRSPGGHRHAADAATEQALERAREAVLRLLDHPEVLALVVAGLIALGLLLLVLAWVSARAEFVFLDNVAMRRAAFTEPWQRCGKLGRSLFLWRAAFSFAFIVPLAIILGPFVPSAIGVFRGESPSLPAVAGMVLGVLVGGCILLVLAWIYWMTDTFVVPLMYRHGENATEAWARFRPLLAAQAGPFLAFTAFYLVLSIAAALGLAIAGVGTCCIGLVLMVIPYVGNVLLLPVTVTARAFGPEFLAQFGPEWTVFPATAEDDEDDARMPVL